MLSSIGDEQEEEALPPPLCPPSAANKPPTSAQQQLQPPAPRREPAFENMCGSTFVYGFYLKPSTVPRLPQPPPVPRCPKSGRHVRGSSSSVPPPAFASSSSSTLTTGGGSSSSSHGCITVFSVHGNLTLRRQATGTAVTFKVKHLPLFFGVCVSYPLSYSLHVRKRGVSILTDKDVVRLMHYRIHYTSEKEGYPSSQIRM